MIADELARAQARERVATEAYQRQQTAQREGEALYMAALERAAAAEVERDRLAERLHATEDGYTRARAKLDADSAERRAQALAKYPPALATMKGVAYEYGYALAVHGSEARDLDVIAVPWTEGAGDPYTLAEALRAAVGGVIHHDSSAQPGDWTRRNPEPKPHGRLAWSIQLGGGLYIDLSVMPRSSEQQG